MESQSWTKSKKKSILLIYLIVSDKKLNFLEFYDDDELKPSALRLD